MTTYPIQPALIAIRMNLLRTIAVVLLVSVATKAFSQEKAKFTDHPFFKHLIGSWKGKGELKAADGNLLKIVEEWTCKVSDEGELVIEGTRVVNDNAEREKFRWSITHNPSTDLYEATHVDAQNSIRFEGTIIGEPLVFELKAQLGNGGGSATVTDSFTGGGHDAFDTKVMILSDSGNTNLEGTIKHERVK